MNTKKADMLFPVSENVLSSYTGEKLYEMTNHLGNVLTVINDIKVPYQSGADILYYATITNTSDYSPFGVTLDEAGGRTQSLSISENDYRYGFGGQEKDDEVSGKGNSYTAEFWQYDSRLGRRWNIDPVTKVHESPYACFANNPIRFTDPNGLDSIDVIITNSSIDGVQEMNFVKTHNNNPKCLRVRYLNAAGKVLWTGDNFMEGTLEYDLFNSESVYYNTTNRDGGRSPTIILEGTAKTPVVTAKYWVAWNRYSTAGHVDPDAETREPNGRPFKRVFANTTQPNTLFFFTAYFENHSITNITNRSQFDQIVRDLARTFANGGTLSTYAPNSDLTSRNVGFVAIGYHSPEPTQGSGLSNTQLAIGRAITIQDLLIARLSFVSRSNCGSATGGDSQEAGVRPVVIYFGVQGFIDRLGITYTPPTIGE